MIVATLKALTWGTVATAVISAVLLAAGGSAMPPADRGSDIHSHPATDTTPAGVGAGRDTTSLVNRQPAGSTSLRR
jgi:hypothetical protein